MGSDTRAPTERRRPGNPTAALLTILLLISLGIHAWTILTLYRVRTVARIEVAAFTNQIIELRDSGISFTVPVSQTVPIAASVPIRQRFNVPVDTVVAINDTVTVPIDTPFGSTSFSLPVQANIPIRVTVPVTIEETIDIATSVGVHIDVPINLTVSDTSIQQYLDNLLLRLEALQAEL